MLIREVEPAADDDLAGALLVIQHAAYAVEAVLLNDDRIPPLHEHVDDLRKAPLRWLGAFAHDRLLGALAWSNDNDQLDVDRLMVAPSAHRRGVGTALVLEVLRHAGNRRVIVSTGRDNPPARAFYERLGFTRVADEQIVPGLWVTHYAYLRSIGPDSTS